MFELPQTRWMATVLAATLTLGCRGDVRTAGEGGSATLPSTIDRVVVGDPQYPADWWKHVPPEGAPSWEILPQEAGPGEVILSKRHTDLGLLSNFAAARFTYRGKSYASLEGFWQAMKYPESADDPRSQDKSIIWLHTRDEVAQMSGFEAKHAGDLASSNMRAMGIDWVTFEGRRLEYRPVEPGEHYQIIVEATREKVKQNPDVQKALLATGDLSLRPDHQQGDDARAAWRYYEILTEIRSDLQSR